MDNITFRDGSEGYPGLDRLVQFDRASRSFGIMAGSTRKKPRSYTWRCKEHFDQGREGACVGFGLSHELAARPAEVRGLDYNFAKKIYWEAQKNDPWPGGSYLGAHPRYEGTSVLSGIQVCKSLGWFDSYRWAFGLDDLILGVGYNGPALLGVSWYAGMYDVDTSGYVHATGEKVGGHCILCNAVDVKKQRFTLHNSWGKNWGMNGECYVSFKDMEFLLDDRGEAAFLLKRHSKLL